jgi:hypothetical protein
MTSDPRLIPTVHESTLLFLVPFVSWGFIFSFLTRAFITSWRGSDFDLHAFGEAPGEHELFGDGDVLITEI